MLKSQQPFSSGWNSRFVSPFSSDELLKDGHHVQSHPDYDGDLFHQHIQAIDAWTLDQIEWLLPHAPIATPTSILFLPFPKLDGGMDLDKDSKVLMTIAELRPSHVGTHYPYTELFFHMNVFSSPAFDLLLREFMEKPTRSNQQYQLDGEKCARLARNLWIYLLP